MSPSDNDAPRALLIASGPPGIEIQVLDGKYQVQARGAERLETHLPRGLYIVRWIGPAAVTDEVVRLEIQKKALRVPFPAAAAAAVAASALPPAATASAPMPKSKLRRGADIVILEESDDSSLVGRLSQGLRLYNADDTALRSDSGAVAVEREAPAGQNGWTLRVYHVDPGCYRLRYDAVSDRTLDQTVTAMAGRRTMVLLRQASGQTLAAQGKGKAESYVSLPVVGVDPPGTVMMTTSLGQRGPPSPDQLRLAKALLGALSRGGDALSRATLHRIEAVGADPLLRIYAAALILAALGQDRSPALDDPYPVGGGEAAFARRWRGIAERLLDGLPIGLDSPDVAACDKALGRAMRSAPTAPPMLAACWSWLRSDGGIGLPEDRPSLRAAAAGGEAAGPWLAWNAAALKSGVVAARKTMVSRSGLPSINELRAPAQRSASTTLSAELPGRGGLGAASAVVMLAAILAAGGAALLWGPDVGDGPRAWTTMAMPIFGWAAAIPTVAVLAVFGWRRQRRWFEARSRPPGLERPVLFVDDAHKGRFGERASLGGFTLRAEFQEPEDKTFAWVGLRVEADECVRVEKGEQAIFYLHHTFHRDRVAAPFQHGVARLDLEAFGGFTVGVWLPRRRLQLELDLAELADAPQAIREW